MKKRILSFIKGVHASFPSNWPFGTGTTRNTGTGAGISNPVTGLPSTRDECWDFVREVNLADIGEAPALVFNPDAGDFELA